MKKIFIILLTIVTAIPTFALKVNDNFGINGLVFFRNRTNLTNTYTGKDDKTVKTINNYFLLIGRLGIDVSPTKNATAHLLFNYSSPAGLITLPMLSNTNISKVASEEEKPGLSLTNAYIDYTLDKLSMKMGLIKEKSTTTRDNFYASVHKENSAYKYAADEFFSIFMNNSMIGYLANYQLAKNYNLGLGITRSTENGNSTETTIGSTTTQTKTRDLTNLHFNLPMKFGGIGVEPEGIITLDSNIKDISAGMDINIPVKAIGGKVSIGGAINSRKQIDSTTTTTIKNGLLSLTISTTVMKTDNFKFAPKLRVAGGAQTEEGFGDISTTGMAMGVSDLQLITVYKGLIIRPRYRYYHRPNLKSIGENYTRQKFDFDFMVKF